MRVSMVAALLLGLTSCDKWDHRLDKMETWKDKLCKCDSPGCVTNVRRDFEAWWLDATRDDSVSGGELAFLRIPKDKEPRYRQLRDAMSECASRH